MLDLILRIALDPKVASHTAALLVGEPALASELVATCTREAPRCQIRGEHPKDSWASGRVWERAMRKGALDPNCSWHWPMPGRNFSTSGPWGGMRVYQLKHIAAATGISCMPLQVLDIPIVGAIATALRMQAACARYDACNAHDRRIVWAGLSRWLGRGEPDRRPYGGIFSIEWGGSS